MIRRLYFCLCVLILVAAPAMLKAQTEKMMYNGKKITIAQCLELAEIQLQQGDIKEATRFVNQAAAIHWDRKEYKPAIGYFERSLKLNQEIGNENGVSMISNNLGMLYADIQQYETSLYYFQSTLQTRRKMKETLGIISALINISVVLNNLKRYEQSAVSLEEALQLATERSDTSQMRSCYGLLAETYRYTNNQEKFTKYFELYRTFHDLEQRQAQKQQEKYTQNIARTQLILLQNEINSRKQELELLEKEKQLENTEQKIRYLNVRTQHLLDSLLKSSSKYDLAIWGLNNQNKVKALQLEKQQEELSQKAYLTKILLIGIGLLLLTKSFLLLVYIQKRKKNRLLALRNSQIDEQRKEIEKQHEAILRQNHALLQAQATIETQNKQLLSNNRNLEKEIQEHTQQLKQTNTELIEQNTQLEQYSYMTAHNLRGPVARILGLVSILNPQNPTDQTNQLVLENVQKEAHHLDSVIKDMNQILDIRKGIRNHLEGINLLTGVAFALSNFRTELDNLEASVVIQIPETTTVYFVKSYLDSVLYNCISNAIKYRHPGRKLVLELIATIENDTFVSLSIRDNGLGIDLSRHGNKLFGLYKRFHSHREGKGLGLYLIKTQMEALDGRIEIQSHVNEGTTLQLFFKKAQVASNDLLEHTMNS